MADLKYSEATQVTTPARTTEWGVSEAGASKALSLGQAEEFAHDKGADVASAATVTLGDGHYFHITGTTTITDIDFTDSYDGRYAILVFDGSLTLTHNATTLILPGGANIQTQAGDTATIVVDAGDNVKVVSYTRAAELGSIGTNRVRSLAASHTLASATATEVTGLGPMTLEAGTYVYRYVLIVASSLAGTGVGLGINFTGTSATRTIHMRYGSTGTTAISGVIDDVGANAGQIVEWNGNLTFSTTTPNMLNTAGFATANANCHVTIEGVLVVTASGDLELWHSSETANNTSVIAGSSLIVIRTA